MLNLSGLKIENIKETEGLAELIPFPVFYRLPMSVYFCAEYTEISAKLFSVLYIFA